MHHVRGFIALIGVCFVVALVIGAITFNSALFGWSFLGLIISGVLCFLLTPEQASIEAEARRRIRREDAKRAAQKFEDDVLKEIARMRASDKG